MRVNDGAQAILAMLSGELRTILFDLDGTLRTHEPAADRAIYDFAVQLGAEDGPGRRRSGAYWAHYYWAQSEELKHDLERYGEMELNFWINYMVRSLLAFGCTSERARELAPVIQAYMQEQYRPDDVLSPGVPETLAVLKAAGFRLGLLSNRSSPCNDYLAEIELDGYFELALVAGEVTSWKPDPGLFDCAVERMGAAKEESIYIGDNYFADAVGARRAGIQPVLYDPLGVFPDADCPVVGSIGELEGLVAARGILSRNATKLL